eukprot:m.193295 g.193295  ORF g.193295 m.193295 type:complete len:77 (+) comp18629_c0_seq2:1145-1375(+)
MRPSPIRSMRFTRPTGGTTSCNIRRALFTGPKLPFSGDVIALEADLSKKQSTHSYEKLLFSEMRYVLQNRLSSTAV